MSEWNEYKLKDVSGVQTGPFGSQLHQSDYRLVGTPIITVEHLGENKILHQNLPLVSDEDKERLNKYVLQEGDIVFSRVGSVDRRAYVSKQENGWMFSGRCLRVRVNRSIVDPKYLSYYFGQESFKEHIRMIAVGATMPSINTEILSGVDLNLPALVEQQAIASVLSSLDDKIDLLHRQNKTLEALAETLFRQWFVADEKEKKIGYIGDLVEETIGGEWGKEVATGDFVAPAYCIRGTDLADIRFGLPDRAPLRFIKKTKLKNIEPQEGDLIIEISGGTDNQSTGRTIYVDEHIKSLFGCSLIFSNFCRLIRPQKKEYMYFIYCYFQFLYEQGDMFNLENGSSGIKNLDYKSLLNSYSVDMPKNEETIITFHRKVEPLFNKVGKNRIQIRTLTRLRDNLLPKLMSGEVRVKETVKTL